MMPRLSFFAALALAACAFCASLRAQESGPGDRFVWGQWKHDKEWNPYPQAAREALSDMEKTTSLIPADEVRALGLEDPKLFETPFLYLSGKDRLPPLTPKEIGLLRNYLTSGGFLFIEDASGQALSSFDPWVRSQLRYVLPESPVEVLPSTHAVFRAYYLIHSIGGRRVIRPHIEGADFGGRTCVIYSRNDILGTWAKDALGNFMHHCVPGGEEQRRFAHQLLVNVVMYALTGSYKLDAVHQPFLLQKLRQASQIP